MLKGLGCDMIEVERIRQALSWAELSASGLHAGRARGHCPQGRADRGGLLGGQRGGEQGAGYGL